MPADKALPPFLSQKFYFKKYNYVNLVLQSENLPGRKENKREHKVYLGRDCLFLNTKIIFQ